jgi:hypothetical protein
MEINDCSKPGHPGRAFLFLFKGNAAVEKTTPRNPDPDIDDLNNSLNQRRNMMEMSIDTTHRRQKILNSHITY